MPDRPEKLQTLFDRLQEAYAQFSTNDGVTAVASSVFAALATPGEARTGAGETLDVCSHLAPALDNPAFDGTPLHGLAEAIEAVAGDLVWKRRAGNETASANFAEGHANAVFAGPEGIEERDDMLVGVSLLAPHVRYPDHRHPPEEAYIVLSPGEFRQASGDWFSPGIGGTLYNTPDIVHAMRSGEQPLLAIWCLPLKALPRP